MSELRRALDAWMRPPPSLGRPSGGPPRRSGVWSGARRPPGGAEESDHAYLDLLDRMPREAGRTRTMSTRRPAPVHRRRAPCAEADSALTCSFCPAGGPRRRRRCDIVTGSCCRGHHEGVLAWAEYQQPCSALRNLRQGAGVRPERQPRPQRVPRRFNPTPDGARPVGGGNRRVRSARAACGRQGRQGAEMRAAVSTDAARRQSVPTRRPSARASCSSVGQIPLDRRPVSSWR